MKTIYLSVIFMALIAFSCSESDKILFDGPNSVYFRIADLDEEVKVNEDTLMHSFAFSPDEITQKLVKIPIEISGFAEQADRKYRIRIEEYGDIKSGVHFEEIAEEQTLKAGEVSDTLEVVLNRTVDMQHSSFKFGIHIQEGGDFVCGLKECLFVAVRVSDILEKPLWWDKWQTYFGDYHPIKYKKWMEIWGGTGDLSGKRADWWSSPSELTAVFELRVYFENNPTYDEDGNLIVVPCPM